MGTRADFYVGKGPDAEWLGSTHWDGYPEGFKEPNGDGLFNRPNLSGADWRLNVETMLVNRDDSCTADGWPWPWPDSGTTDYAYTWTEDGGVEYELFGERVGVDAEVDDEAAEERYDKWVADGRKIDPPWPDMSGRRNPEAGYGPGATRVGPIVLM